jgi:hypothetical protein
MFRHDQTEAKIDKQKTDLLTRGAIRVHLIQDTIENEIGSDDKDNGCHEQKCAWDEPVHD